jgi:hypothetical protein
MTTEIGNKKTVRVHIRIDGDGDATAVSQWDIDANGTSLSDAIGEEGVHRDYIIDVTLPVPVCERPADAVLEVQEAMADPAITATQVA